MAHRAGRDDDQLPGLGRRRVRAGPALPRQTYRILGIGTLVSNGFRDEIHGDGGSDVIFGDSKASNHNYTPVAGGFEDEIDGGDGFDTVDGGTGARNTCVQAESAANCTPW